MSKPGIFRVSRPQNDHIDYDEYSSFIVACRDVFVARRTHPRSTQQHVDDGYAFRWSEQHKAWVDSDNEPYFYHAWTTNVGDLVVERLGDASPGVLGVLNASFNAG